MNDRLQTLDAGTAYGGAGALAQRNRVLRNTYWLLALSLLPTVLGAWIGVATGITANLTGGIGLLVFLGGAFGFMFAIERTKNSAAGVPVLLAFTFFMGLMLSRLIGAVLGSYSNGASLIMTAFGGTGLVFAGMATMASTIKRDLSGMGRWLFAGLLVVLVAGVANIWLQMPALFLTVSVICVVLFSAYLLYDLKRVIDGGETNYVTATLAVYLDVYNIFTSLLSLLGFLGGERE